ncbi:Acetyltransferase (GNAT) [Malassezia yamatoensis]|uniref:Acetyltransferase (GNAT) n=1 Tax=Malassezia yamatoensis TaxID=253288 RepID=A0AAJ6CHR8_9BASI|nr:Acetyltransferase (GNAT) [Malassezia yamatoensis]
MSNVEVSVRRADRKDVGTILKFIKELAIYEKALEKVDATEESVRCSLLIQLEETLFSRPYAYVLIAEIQQGSQPVESVGFALYFYAPAIAFYQKTLGAEMLEEWRTLRLEGDGIDRLASLSSTDSQGRSS